MNSSHKSSVERNYYLMGLFTGVVCALIGVSIIYILTNNFIRQREARKIEKPIYVPSDIVEELKEINGIIDYAYQYEHGYIVDARFTNVVEDNLKVMKPNLNIRGYVFKTVKSFNYLPPILYLHENSNISGRLKRYIEENARMPFFRYTTDKDGYRMTLPYIHNDRKILVTGDSVAFGIGVNDDKTIASYIQGLAGDDYSVVNNAVGGYDLTSILKSIARETDRNRYKRLIYIACQNDFSDIKDTVNQAVNNIYRFKDRFSEGICIVYVPYMFYIINDIFLNQMPPEYVYDPAMYVNGTRMIGSTLEAGCKKTGILFIDFTDIADAYMKESKTIWSRFALYNDHAHLSEEANRLLAEAIYAWFIKGDKDE